MRAFMSSGCPCLSPGRDLSGGNSLAEASQSSYGRNQASKFTTSISFISTLSAGQITTARFRTGFWAEAMQSSTLPSDEYENDDQNSSYIQDSPPSLFYSKMRLGSDELDSQATEAQGLSSSLDEEFQRLMAEGYALLKEGEEGLEGNLDVGIAERMLSEAAYKFASATALKPSSVEAIQSWGNSLLVHGQLKLLLSGQLRSVLLESKSPRKDAQPNPSRIAELLPQVCEQCEELLVEAGRKYGMALSIEKLDDCAMYNWGLALCYRAQLIAMEGGEDAANDAEKIYLAAIAKFEATLELSKTFAPGALLNWGLALRDRSWLRPKGSSERVALMQQAKRAFEEALRFDESYTQAKRALAASEEELKELQNVVGGAKSAAKPKSSKGESWWDWN